VILTNPKVTDSLTFSNKNDFSAERLPIKIIDLVIDNFRRGKQSHSGAGAKTG
jgi:hypothetical protein